MKTETTFRNEIADALNKAYEKGTHTEWDELEDEPEVIEIVEEYMNDDDFDLDVDQMDVIIQEQLEKLKESKS